MRSKRLNRRAVIRVALAALPLLAVAPFLANARDHAPRVPPDVMSRHAGTFGGVRLVYAAEGEHTIVADPKGRPIADFYSMSYTAQREPPGKSRPVMFIFNGGPGSSSIWLQLGAFGPYRVTVAAGKAGPGTGSPAFIRNTYSPLDVADLVFVDPVGTGFTRATGKARPADFHSVMADARSVDDFMRAWLVDHRRLDSPVFLVGESYGTVRAAAMMKDMQERPNGINVVGIVLLGQALDTSQTQQTPGNDMPYILYLPSYTAAACYHGRISRALCAGGLLERAQQFASTEYAAALFQGTRLSEAARERIARLVSLYSGLPENLVLACDLRIPTKVFLEQVMASPGEVLVRSDTRFAYRPEARKKNELSVMAPPGWDLAYREGRTRLLEWLGIGHVADYRYVVQVAPGEDLGWSYALPGNDDIMANYFNVSPYIVAAMKRNPHLRVFVGSGLYDLMAAPSSAGLTFSHSGFPKSRVEEHVYPSGHMIYLNQASLIALMGDIRAFVRRQAPAARTQARARSIGKVPAGASA